jgi:multicomponent Na+:H+ antiporter subunit D
MLSFTLVSHIGYMVFGIALASELGLASSIFYTVHHITIQTTLFLDAGLIELRGGSTSVERLGGLARAAPVLALMFFVPAMNLAGIPPFSGFFGKVGLAEAGVANGAWLAYLVVAGSMVTSLLTLWAVAKTWNRAFWKPREAPDADGDLPSESPVAARVGGGGEPVAVGQEVVGSGTKSGRPWAQKETPVRSLPRAMVAPTAALVALGIAITVVAGPLFALTSRAAQELQERTPYISAVLSDGSELGR